MKEIAKYIVDIFMKINYLINKKQYSSVKILTTLDTIDMIVKNRMSVSRFGDGEFLWILEKNKNTFQVNNPKLKEKLIEVLISDEKKLLICLPKVWTSMKENKYSSARYWRLFLYRYFNKIKKYIDDRKIYGNASFTRPYISLKNKKNSKLYFSEIKKIWENRNLTIIEGKNTRLGVGNDLFANTLSIERIICPTENAFECYEKILTYSKTISKDNLILIALGPTATILSYDLSKLGYQAIDIGHIDIEYEWFLRNAKKKINIEGKAVNEVKNNRKVIKSIYDENYEKSIIKVIEMR